LGFQITRRLTIEWGHCDPAGIVFNPRFFEYFDWSTALLVATALALDNPRALMATYNVVGTPLVDTKATFTKPSRFGDDVEIVSRFATVGRSSFEIEHRLYNAGDLAIEVREKRVWTGRDPDTGRLRGVAMPPDVVERFNAKNAVSAPG
jgi:4-hydroxybenzoyl-CoA thioesterase